MTTRCAVYRHFDGAGTLLYVGCAKDPDERLRTHRRSSPWAADIAKITVEWHPDRAAALAAEDKAIATEYPKWNVRGACARPDPEAERRRIAEIAAQFPPFTEDEIRAVAAAARKNDAMRRKAAEAAHA
jgi:hypothetical protein